jgi:F-type H+-transporting ATPase subunit a
MADPVLHIKDSYYFEVPKVLCPANYQSRKDFPEVWVKLDPAFQQWEFERLYSELSVLRASLPPKDQAREDWQHWVHADHANFAKPFDEFLEARYQQRLAEYEAWKVQLVAQAKAEKNEQAAEVAQQRPIDDYMLDRASGDPYATFVRLRQTAEFRSHWYTAKATAGDMTAYKQDTSAQEWNEAKVAAYNGHLSGKILIPQPFGKLRNLYEAESGFCISKYMVLEVAIGLVLLVVFSKVANKLDAGGPPRGYFWNLMEVFLLFIRDQIVFPSIGGGHADGEQDHAADAHGGDSSHKAHSHEAPAAHETHAHSPGEATRLLPLFWTFFFFILACNLFGMIPWLGAPSASFSVTTALALVTLIVGIVSGIRKFGWFGYLGNQIPSMDLPIYMAVVIKPMVFAIEVMGLMIKHGVLAIRLLANMVAGHLVILGIMGVAFGATAAVAFSDPQTPSWQWPLAATIAVVASTLFSLLELFVAFLQAYVFTFLSALFIGAALHKH